MVEDAARAAEGDRCEYRAASGYRVALRSAVRGWTARAGDGSIHCGEPLAAPGALARGRATCVRDGGAAGRYREPVRADGARQPQAGGRAEYSRRRAARLRPAGASDGAVDSGAR